jgi:hypothetical protein
MLQSVYAGKKHARTMWVTYSKCLINSLVLFLHPQVIVGYFVTIYQCKWLYTWGLVIKGAYFEY